MSTFGTVGSTIRLRSGKYFDLLNPRAEDFTIADIAGALSKICRFGGQIERFYSVAEHSFLCAAEVESRQYPRPACVHALLHDAAEAFVGDVVKPLKLLLPAYDEIESRILSVIFAKYDVIGKYALVVKEIDEAMLIAERRVLFSSDDCVWAGENEVRTINPNIRAMNPEDAEAFFLQYANSYDLRRD